MEVAETDRKHQDQSTGLKEEIEKMVEDLQQQMFYIERKIPEKKLHLDNAKSKASYTLDYGWSYGEKWIYKNSELDRKKMELEKLTFAHGAYRDKKNVLSFSSGEPEVNIHNLNYRMLHEARSMDGERRLLNMMNPNKHSNSGFSLKELDHQIWRLTHDLLMKWRLNSVSEREKVRKNLMELVMEREHLFSNSPIKRFLWNSLPSTMDLRNQILTLETIEEEKRKVISKKRKEIETNKRELRKAKNEIKYLRNTMVKIRQQKQKALQNLSHHKLTTCFENPRNLL
ncbi:hypothetical protein V5N11_022149 [Cardamine amara subsp. amara]|uniref:Uncharacterized protein n=1 Tax=Cardamine amara subsp. amara TaxID=228776 RepID=A0ABD1C074_CARAN